MHRLGDTIAAIASPPGGAARGTLRISGPGVRACLERFFRPEPFVHIAAIAVPTAVPGMLWLPGVHGPLPCELYLWPGGRSYTGEPVAEIHTIGSPPLLETAIRAVCAAGARLAEPGEFTLRAFLAGRIDLTQAEAVLGVIDAADRVELDTALAQLAGGLARPLHALRDALLDLLAHLEAGFDFADEDLSFITPEQLSQQLDRSAGQIADMLQRMTSRSLAADRVRVVLMGRPNTGKSSLFNSLVRRAGALVSHLPGTTRDYLSAELDLAGVKCELIDTAGMETPLDRPGTDQTCDIRTAAQAAASAQRQQAHVEVLCLDCARPLDDWEQRELAHDSANPRLIVLTKTDLRGQSSEARSQSSSRWIETSSTAGTGLDALRDAIRRAAITANGPWGDVVVGTAVRCRESLRLAGQCLQRARQIVGDGGGEELVAAEVRVALEELGKVAGAVYTEDLLDRIFSRFCIGK